VDAAQGRAPDHAGEVVLEPLYRVDAPDLLGSLAQKFDFGWPCARRPSGSPLSAGILTEPRMLLFAHGSVRVWSDVTDDGRDARPDAPPARVRLAEPDDVDELASVLALAFDVDPVTRWHVPDDARRIPTMQRFFSFALRTLFIPLRAVWTTEDRSSAAVWLPNEPRPTEEGDEDPMAAAFGDIFGDDAWMVEAILRAQEEQKPEERHHYLQFMGTRPDRQQQGLGAKVLSAGLARCDADAVPAYLDASSRDSRDFYARHGFEELHTFSVPNGPMFWQMRRSPRPAETKP